MGVGFLTGPGVVLSRTEPADKVGQAILKLFPDCGAIVDHPRDFETPDSPVLKLANVSSWSEFRRQRPEYLTATMSATSIEVELFWRDGRGYAPVERLNSIRSRIMEIFEEYPDIHDRLTSRRAKIETDSEGDDPFR
jgi:hypothetical protein